MISDIAHRIILAGTFRARVKRSGMLQMLTFTVKRVDIGSDHFTELYTHRTMDMSYRDVRQPPKHADHPGQYPKGEDKQQYVADHSKDDQQRNPHEPACFVGR